MSQGCREAVARLVGGPELRPGWAGFPDGIARLATDSTLTPGSILS